MELIEDKRVCTKHEEKIEHRPLHGAVPCGIHHGEPQLHNSAKTFPFQLTYSSRKKKAIVPALPTRVAR